jgi:hypothetical protein
MSWSTFEPVNAGATSSRCPTCRPEAGGYCPSSEKSKPASEAARTSNRVNSIGRHGNWQSTLAVEIERSRNVDLTLSKPEDGVIHDISAKSNGHTRPNIDRGEIKDPVAIEIEIHRPGIEVDHAGRQQIQCAIAAVRAARKLPKQRQWGQT